MKNMEISLVICMAGIIFPALYKGAREGRGNMTNKITLDGEGKTRGSILLHSSLRAGLKLENLSCTL